MNKYILIYKFGELDWEHRIEVEAPSMWHAKFRFFDSLSKGNQKNLIWIEEST